MRILGDVRPFRDQERQDGMKWIKRFEAWLKKVLDDLFGEPPMGPDGSLGVGA